MSLGLFISSSSPLYNEPWNHTTTEHHHFTLSRRHIWHHREAQCIVVPHFHTMHLYFQTNKKFALFKGLELFKQGVSGHIVIVGQLLTKSKVSGILLNHLLNNLSFLCHVFAKKMEQRMFLIGSIERVSFTFKIRNNLC